MCDELPVTLMTDMLSGLTEHKNYISYHSLQVEVAVMVLVLGNSWKPGLGSPSFPCPSELSSKIMEKNRSTLVHVGLVSTHRGAYFSKGKAKGEVLVCFS